MSVLELIAGECFLHGWHGKTICPQCRDQGQITLPVLAPPEAGKPRRYELIKVSASLIRFHGGGRQKMHQEARCRMCLRPRGPDTRHQWMHQMVLGVPYELSSRPLTRHHLLPEHWFKNQLPPTKALRGVEANIVPLCRPCHDQVERDAESRRMLRRVLGSDEVAFMIQLAGQQWMDKRYPS